MLDDVLNDIPMPQSVSDVTQDIDIGSLPDWNECDNLPKKDIFAAEQRKAWDKSVEARCDFTPKLRLTRRASTNFISLWQKSIFGRTLTEIKADDSMVQFFIDSLVPIINECVGYHISSGNWAIVTTPMRRHKERQILCKPSAEELAIMPRCSQDSRPEIIREGRNFASRIAEGIGSSLGIPFYFDCAHCQSKQRVGAVFLPNNIPAEPNVIVFDDFVTTGSTLLAMKNLLHEHQKNTVFITGINNKL